VKFFANMKIAHRLSLGLGGIILLMGAVCTKSYLGFEEVHESFGQFSQAGDQTKASEELRIAIADFVGLAKEYVARNTEARYRRTLDSYAAVQDKLKEAARHTNGSYGDALKGASAATTSLRETFEQFVAARRERNTVVERVGSTVADALQSVAGEAAAAPLAVALLQAKDRMQLFIDRPQAETMIEARRHLEDASGAAKTLMDRDGSVRRVAAVTSDLAQIEKLIGQEAQLADDLFGPRVSAVRAAAERMITATRVIEQRSAQAFVAAKLSAENVILAGGIIALVVGLAVVLALTRSIARPIVAMTESMKRLAANDLDVRVPGVGRRDEVGAMAGAMQTFVEMALERRRLEEEQKRTFREQQHRQDEIDQMIGMFGRSMDGMLKQMEGASSGMAATSEEMLSSARTNMQRAERVQSSTQRVHDNANAVAAAAEQLRSSVDEIARQINTASLMSREVAASAAASEQKVDALTRGVLQVTEVVQLIRSISERTNLLALNATIEAARAGESGKGFAVVAAEVKSLANQTTRATDDIQKVIEEIGSATNEAVDSMRSISGKITELDSVSQSVAAATLQQGEATAEIARSVHQVTVDLDGVRQEVAGVHDSGAVAERTSQTVRQSAGTLAGEASVLSSEVRNFLDGICDGERRDRIQRREVRMPARVRASGREIATTIVCMSPAIIELDGNVDVAPGGKVSIAIEGLGDVQARLAHQTGRTTVLQLPLNREHLDQMCRFMERLAA
jgi:methyl-accepting chemotaxis protein